MAQGPPSQHGPQGLLSLPRAEQRSHGATVGSGQGKGRQRPRDWVSSEASRVDAVMDLNAMGKRHLPSRYASETHPGLGQAGRRGCAAPPSVPWSDRPLRTHGGEENG